MRTILLDTGPLGLLVHRTGVVAADACRLWLRSVVESAHRVVIPEISDYELRRELPRLGHHTAINRLDRFKASLEYLPITTETMLLAASLWAESRRAGVPTADPNALDGDVILAAQAILLNAPDTVIATTNPSHLSRFAFAVNWMEVR